MNPYKLAVIGLALVVLWVWSVNILASSMVVEVERPKLWHEPTRQALQLGAQRVSSYTIQPASDGASLQGTPYGLEL